MPSSPGILMIGAMYENGGNTTHRFLDGHEQLLVYPFESQLGTRQITDQLASVFPTKYRWPVFALDATPEADYFAIIDEECKVRTRTPHVSKFRHIEFDLSDDERRDAYVRRIEQTGRSRPKNVMAFFEATAETWRNRRSSGAESVHVGYSPIITVDADVILGEMPEAHFLHVVRNPWSAYADTKKRPVPLSLDSYMLGWSLTQRAARLAVAKYPERMHIVRIEDVLDDPAGVLGGLCESIGIESRRSFPGARSVVPRQPRIERRPRSWTATRFVASELPLSRTWTSSAMATS
jgi:sulfotransferase family protein